MAETAEYVEYVRGSEYDHWHWCKNCPQYPFYTYERRFDRPQSNLCPQCEAKEHNFECETKTRTGEEQDVPHLDKLL